MSKHSMRRGKRRQRQRPRAASRARRTAPPSDVVEPRLVGERRVARGQVDAGRASRRAAARTHAHPPPGALRQPRSRAPRASSGALGTCTSGGAAAILVELLHRRLPARSARRRRRRSGLGRRQLDALDHAAARAPGTPARPRRPARSSRRTRRDRPARARRHLLLPIAQRLHGAHRVAQLRRLLEPLALRGLRPSARAASRPARRSCPRGTAACRATACRVLLGRADRLDARRHAALDVVLEARPVRACR